MPSNFIINLLNNQDSEEKKTKNLFQKLAPIVKFLFYFILFSTVILITFSFNVVFSDSVLSQGSPISSSWKKIKEIVVNPEKRPAMPKDRINIMLLGVGGEGHDGAYLTDTIMLLSVNVRQKKAALLSIPRDLYVSVPGYGWRKINQAVALEEIKNPGQGEGELLLAQIVNEVFNIPIHYYVRVDFEAFKNIIDIIGGIDVYVDNTLIDYTFPAAGQENAESYDARFESLIIKKGAQHLDGDLALKYVRSRHALGAEGSDFARSSRQQKVLLAVKKKILSFSFLLQPQKVIQILDTLQEHIKTNLEVGEIIRLAQIAKEIDANSVKNKVLNNDPDGPLYADMSADGAYILKPKAGNFSELARIAKDIFKDDNK